MALSTPVIQGAPSPWSASIAVEGCLPGATVVVRSIGPHPRDIAKGTAKGGSDHINLVPGTRLEPKDLLVCFQHLGSENSLTTPRHLGVEVGSTPKDHGELEPVSILSRIWECGHRVWVAGAMPGALVTIRNAGVTLGTAQANHDGDARPLLAPAIPSLGHDDTITAFQDAPPGFPPLTGTPQPASKQIHALPLPITGLFPTPAVDGDPPKGCDPAITIADVLDGADVAITHGSDGSVETVTFDLERLNFVLRKPLPAPGEKLQITQVMPRCFQRLISAPLVVVAGPASRPGQPVVRPPCANSVDVHVENLEPGALVSLTHMSTNFRGMVPPGARSFTFRIERLTGGQHVTVVQERCGLISDPGAARVTVAGSPSSGGVASIVGPLYACARAVRVLVELGSWFQIWAEDDTGGRRALSGMLYADQNSLRIEITPYLLERQHVWVAFLPCGSQKWGASPRYPVQNSGNIPPPKIAGSLTEGDISITVDAMPGALVEVSALVHPSPDPQELGSGLIDVLDKTIRLRRPLPEGAFVFATQFVCNRRVGPGPGRSANPATRVFQLTSPIQGFSPRNNPKPLVCDTATVTCRHSGSWEFRATLQNLETEADCDFLLQFDAVGLSPAFGLLLEGQLSAAGDGPVTRTGLGMKGVHSSGSFPRSGNFAQFQDGNYWEQVLGAAPKFTLIPTFRDYAPPPDAPDSSD